MESPHTLQRWHVQNEGPLLVVQSDDLEQIFYIEKLVYLDHVILKKFGHVF
jgi:hypothetical protein